MLKVRWKNGDNVPSFKYETRTYSCVVANSDVGTQEMIIEVLNGIDIPGNQKIDTYVRVEFNFPSTVIRTSFFKFWQSGCFTRGTTPVCPLFFFPFFCIIFLLTFLFLFPLFFASFSCFSFIFRLYRKKLKSKRLKQFMIQ